MEDKPGSDAGSATAQEKPGKVSRGTANPAALALELPFVLVGTSALGAAIGYFIDARVHTKPIFMFVFGALGFAGGVRELLRRLPG